VKKKIKLAFKKNWIINELALILDFLFLFFPFLQSSIDLRALALLFIKKKKFNGYNFFLKKPREYIKIKHTMCVIKRKEIQDVQKLKNKNV
jgi:hypothetical protein